MRHRKSVSIKLSVFDDKRSKYRVYYHPRTREDVFLGSFRLKKNAVMKKKQFINGKKRRGTW